MPSRPEMKRRARELRRDPTPTERLLWRRLRARGARHKFRRQQVIDDYIVDFYCAAARLVVELDGESHLGRERRDARRQRALESHGLEVLRFWDTEVHQDVESVLNAVYEACERRTGSKG